MERLTRTDIAQPALFMVECACAAAAGERGLTARAVAGFSLGEWSACHQAGMMGFEQAFSLVVRRGQMMQACAQEHPGGMVAVLRLDADAVKQALEGHPGVWAVNFNAPDQTVVAGAFSDLDRFEAALKAAGGRSLRLNGGAPLPDAGGRGRPVSGAGRAGRADAPHPGLRQRRSTALRGRTRQGTAGPAGDPAMRWTDTLRNMAKDGIDAFLELGPGKVLSGLIAKTLPGAAVYQAEDMEGLLHAAEALGGGA